MKLHLISSIWKELGLQMTENMNDKTQKFEILEKMKTNFATEIINFFELLTFDLVMRKIN